MRNPPLSWYAAISHPNSGRWMTDGSEAPCIFCLITTPVYSRIADLILRVGVAKTSGNGIHIVNPIRPADGHALVTKGMGARQLEAGPAIGLAPPGHLA